MEVIEEGLFQVLLAANRICRQTVEPVPSWPLEFQREVFDGVEIIVAGHMNVENEVFHPHRGVRDSIVSFYIHGFEPFWEFMIQDIIGEAMRVCGASISGRIAT